jgi:two-component sensor histidine kinase/PAS domain-containing protein
MIISVAVTFIPGLHKWLYQIFLFFNLLIALAIFQVGYFSTPMEPGYNYYYTWVMLVVIGLFVFYRMPFRTLAIIGLVQLIGFLAATVMNGTLEEDPFLFYNTLFFVIATYSIGFMMAFMFRQINMKEFMHQKIISENNKKLLDEIRERKQAVVALQHSEIQYHDTLDSIPDWILVVNREFRIVVINSSLREAHRIAGITEDVKGKYILDVYPFVTGITASKLEKVFSGGEIQLSEQNMTIGNLEYYLETRMVPIMKEGEVVQVVTILRDRTKEKEVDSLKQKNAEQKEIMLREIHHRVKNNLAIVISLLNLQLRNNPNPELRRIMHDIEMRIRSMALIHEHLYRSENLNHIPLADYIQSLATIITGTFSGYHADLILELDPMDVSIETALPIGLITNELLTNAFKYAFPELQHREIKIRLFRKNEQSCILTIADNGVGLPADFSIESDKSLGMFIVRLLVEQIDGIVDYTRSHGTTFTITFPISYIRKSINQL